MDKKTHSIYNELRSHVPFTIVGAITGIIILIILQGLFSAKINETLFYIFHPVHVFLSALVTASMYKLHMCKKFSLKCLTWKCNFWKLCIIGYIGSIGIATISDSIFPYLGEILLDLPHRHAHIGFIEKWWLVNPLAILGVFMAYKKPSTKFPHAGHVLLSTWASSFHILMAIGGTLNWAANISIFIILAISVWIPCCLSDIIFPLFLVKKQKN